LHLDKRLIQTPALALEQVKKELARMIKIADTMLDLSFERFEKRIP
jgi:Na+/phosphate symporter